MTATLHMDGFDAATDLYDRLPIESEFRQQAFLRLIAGAGRVAPERGCEWLIEVGSDFEIDRAMHILMLSWANTGNLDTAGRYMETLEAGMLRDKVVASFVKGAGERDLDRALRWAETIEDEEQRETLVRQTTFRQRHR